MNKDEGDLFGVTYTEGKVSIEVPVGGYFARELAIALRNRATWHEEDRRPHWGRLLRDLAATLEGTNVEEGFGLEGGRKVSREGRSAGHSAQGDERHARRSKSPRDPS